MPRSATDGVVIEELTRDESEAFLRRQAVGRIGCHAGGRTYVVPVIYAWDDGCAYVQSIEGRKIAMMRENPEVCFEVDEYEPDSGSWHSVIVEGTYEELDATAAEKALALLVSRFQRSRGPSREPRSPRPVVAFRIRALEVTGRRVERTRTMSADHAAAARRSDT